MIGGPLFEIVLVLFFVFLTLSGLVSLLQEVFAQVFQMKAGNLHKCINELLSDAHYGKRISKRFFEHPLVTSLGGRRRQPTWVTEDVFAIAFATAIQPEWSKTDPVDALPGSIEALHDGALKERLRLALPQAKPGADRKTITAAIKTWFDTNGTRMSDRYKADARARLYIISAVVTVLFNISPIEIVKRLNADSTLRTAFSSAVPELTTLLFNSGQGLPFSSAQNDEPEPTSKAVPTPPALAPTAAPGATPVAGPTPPTTAQAAIDLVASATRKQDLQRMLALFHCSQSELSLPVGWPWMAGLTRQLDTKAAGLLSFSGEQATCQRALAQAGASKNLLDQLTIIGGESLAGQARTANAAMLGGATMPAGDRAYERQYGPSFDRDPAYMILAGWLIAMLAGAQGAPFWFNLLKKVIERKP